MVYIFKKYVTKRVLLFNDNIDLIRIYWNAFTTCIDITLRELLNYYLVNKQTTWHNPIHVLLYLSYYIDWLWYIFINDMRLETHGYMTIRDTKLMYETFNLTIYCIHHLIWYYIHIFVHSISIHVSHHLYTLPLVGSPTF